MGERMRDAMVKEHASASAADREGGFTLVELLVALTIFTFGMLGVVGMFVTSIKGNAQGRHMTEATSLAQSKLDFLLTSEPYADVTCITTFSEPKVMLNATGISYARRWIATRPVAGIDMKQIDVTVSWSSLRYGAGEDGKLLYHEVKLTSVRAKDK